MKPPYLEITSGPGGGTRAVLNRSPFRIGRSIGADFRMDAPGIPDELCVLFEEEQGWVVTLAGSAAGRATISKNGGVVTRTTLLGYGDTLGLPSGITLRFVDPGVQAAERIETVAPRARPAAAPPTPPVRSGFAFRRFMRRVRDAMPSGRRLVWIVTGFVALTAAIVIAVIAVRSARTVASSVVAQEQPLSEADGLLFESLLVEAYDHLERGAALLDIGAPDGALKEFARAVNTLQTSRIGNNPWVTPRIEALEAQVATMYRTRNIGVPSSYASVRARVALRLRSSVSPEQFGGLVEQVRSAFATRWSRPLTITGRDHAEHLALYGPGSAIDLRTKDLGSEEVRWVVSRLRAAGLRVKDFSADSVLMDQIARANAAGVPDRAGTGLHVHVDRFPGKSDRYTVGG